jgi:transposase
MGHRRTADPTGETRRAAADMRAVFNAIVYVLRAGCQWRRFCCKDLARVRGS